VPSGMNAPFGVTVMDTREAEGITTRLAVPETVPTVAVIVVVPTATLVACPCEPLESLIVATAVPEEVQ
jgi:hypothetical protein